MIIVYILGGLVLLIGVLALVAPREMRMERHISISASPERAFSELRSLQYFDKWSPWYKRDIKQERGYKGTDGELGSIGWWRGNKDVGEGEQEVIKLQPNTYVEMELRFIKPFKAVNTAYFKIAPEQGGGSKVTWGFHAKFAIPMNIMMMVFNMEKTLGADFEKGLSSYKALSDQGA